MDQYGSSPQEIWNQAIVIETRVMRKNQKQVKRNMKQVKGNSINTGNNKTLSRLLEKLETQKSHIKVTQAKTLKSDRRKNVEKIKHLKVRQAITVSDWRMFRWSEKSEQSKVWSIWFTAAAAAADAADSVKQIIIKDDEDNHLIICKLSKPQSPYICVVFEVFGKSFFFSPFPIPQYLLCLLWAGFCQRINLEFYNSTFHHWKSLENIFIWNLEYFIWKSENIFN